MKLIEFLSPQGIIPRLKRCDLESILKELAEAMLSANRGLPLSKEELSKALIEREKLGSTAIGGGLAIPHCRIDGLPGVLASLGICPQGIEITGNKSTERVKIFFAIASPSHEIALHLRLLARICRVFKNSSLLENLVKKESPEEILRAIEEAESDL